MGGNAEVSQPPHGIMDLQPQSADWGLVILSLLIVLFLVFVGYWLYRRYQSRQKARPTGPLSSRAAAADPWTLLDQRWAQLQIANPWTRENCEEFFFQLSFMLRQALELRTGLPITGQTLAETRRSLEKNLSLSANFQQELLQFLSQAEQLKFAGLWIDAAESSVWQQKVKGWLDQIRSGALS